MNKPRMNKKDLICTHCKTSFTIHGICEWSESVEVWDKYEVMEDGNIEFNKQILKGDQYYYKCNHCNKQLTEKQKELFFGC